MQFVWIDRKETFDHEVLWLSVTSFGAFVCWIWVQLSLPTPGCTFKTLTGIPCPSCGATRMVISILDLNFAAAIVFNPLMAAIALFVACFNVYALVVILMKWPRLRIEKISKGTQRILRVLIVAVLFANWWYLIWAGV